MKKLQLLSKINMKTTVIKDKFEIIKGIQSKQFNFWRKRSIGDICLHIMA